MSDQNSPTTRIISEDDYGASNIHVLEGLEAVRKRPGMYIGNTGKEGLHRCLGEILDNSVDEFMAGHAKKIYVEIDDNNTVYISDDGRGIPTDIHPKTGRPALETILTVLHAGGKFDQKNYKFAGGLHGVGASVVNALSKKLKVWVFRNEEYFYQEFVEGKPEGEMEKFTSQQFLERFPEIQEKLVWTKSGTLIAFLPDETIFETSEFDFLEIKETLEQTAYLNKNIVINFKYKEEKPLKFYFPNGILTFLENIAIKDTLLTPIIHFEAEVDNFHLELAMAWASDHKEKLLPFTNGILNNEGGMHVTGFKTALTKVVNNYAMNKGVFKKNEKFTSDDLKEGQRTVLSIKMVDAQFTSQSKVKLGSTIARKLTDRIISEKFETFLGENPKVAIDILQKVQLSMKARLAAKAARESVVRKGALENLSLPGKLADCSEKDPSKSEIFIVEGDSAGGSAKQGRDRHTQAILALRGKVLNTERASLEKIMNYEGIKNMILAFGTGIGEKFDIEKLRYHKIVIMTDADVDGAHITTLLLTFLYRYMPILLEEGYVYMARPPLYKIKSGRFEEYVYSDIERDRVLIKIKEIKAEAKIDIQRYKGLGEMNPQQLWETTMDPKKRLLWQVTIGEAQLADQVFQDLMGNEVAPRRKFIEENAWLVEDVDLV